MTDHSRNAIYAIQLTVNFAPDGSIIDSVPNQGTESKPQQKTYLRRMFPKIRHKKRGGTFYIFFFLLMCAASTGIVIHLWPPASRISVHDIPDPPESSDTEQDESNNPLPVAPTEEMADPPITPPEPSSYNQIDISPPPAAPIVLENAVTKQLLERGKNLFRLGDISAARAFFEKALQISPSPETMIAMGNTYDPSILQTIDARGNMADASMALRWYQMADQQGHPGAENLIRRLLKTNE